MQEIVEAGPKVERSWVLERGLTDNQKQLRRRILKISHEAKASHLGSCLSAVDIIDAIYSVKKPGEKFILSAGHAGVALYVVLEKHDLLQNPNLRDFHVHPDRDPQRGIEVTTGSLGHGLPIALGMALADRSKRVYSLITDGECAEGSIWETLRLASEQKLTNLKVVCNANGFGAYGEIDTTALMEKFKAFGWELLDVDGHNIKQIETALQAEIPAVPVMVVAQTTVEQFSFLKGQQAHYHVMSDANYQEAIEQLR